jgi:hypothetical protein
MDKLVDVRKPVILPLFTMDAPGYYQYDETRSAATGKQVRKNTGLI